MTCCGSPNPAPYMYRPPVARHAACTEVCNQTTYICTNCKMVGVKARTPWSDGVRRIAHVGRRTYKGVVTDYGHRFRFIDETGKRRSVQFFKLAK